MTSPCLANPSVSSEAVFAAGLGILLSLAMTLGGSNQQREGLILVLELFALALFPVVVWRLMTRGTDRSTWWLVALAGFVLAVPMAQLAPLPVEVWIHLPGRALAIETLQAAGAAIGPRPLSLDPDRTWASFLWLWPGITLGLGAATLDLPVRQRLLQLVLALLILGLALAALQVTWGARSLQPAAEVHAGLPIGFFANRNHQAVALVAGLPLIACLAVFRARSGAWKRRAEVTLYTALSGLLVVGVVATRSRAGLVLGGLALLMSLASFLWFRRRPDRTMGGGLWIVLGGAAVLLLALQIGAGAVLERFDQLETGEGRFQSWPVILDLARDFQPAGSGLGSFETIFSSVEPVEMVEPAYLNNAHNDFLELWLEAGLLFPLGLLLFLAWFALAAVRAFRDPGDQAAVARAAAIGLLSLLLHSVVDYPLRTQALACLFALFCGLLAPCPAKQAAAGAITCPGP
jgi:O-antigen ligase